MEHTLTADTVERDGTQPSAPPIPPAAPIITLGKQDDFLAASLTVRAAMAHIKSHLGATGTLDDFDWFDGAGRQLQTTDELDGLEVADTRDRSVEIRRRVGKVFFGINLAAHPTLDLAPLDLPYESIGYELFAWRLAALLESDPDPAQRDHSAGKLHNAVHQGGG